MITDGRFFSVRMLNVEAQSDRTFSDTPVTQKWETRAHACGNNGTHVHSLALTTVALSYKERFP